MIYREVPSLAWQIVKADPLTDGTEVHGDGCYGIDTKRNEIAVLTEKV